MFREIEEKQYLTCRYQKLCESQTESTLQKPSNKNKNKSTSHFTVSMENKEKVTYDLCLSCVLSLSCCLFSEFLSLCEPNIYTPSGYWEAWCKPQRNCLLILDLHRVQPSAVTFLRITLSRELPCSKPHPFPRQSTPGGKSAQSGTALDNCPKSGLFWRTSASVLPRICGAFTGLEHSSVYTSGQTCFLLTWSPW